MHTTMTRPARPALRAVLSQTDPGYVPSNIRIGSGVVTADSPFEIEVDITCDLDGGQCSLAPATIYVDGEPAEEVDVPSILAQTDTTISPTITVADPGSHTIAVEIEGNRTSTTVDVGGEPQGSDGENGSPDGPTLPSLPDRLYGYPIWYWLAAGAGVLGLLFLAAAA